MTADQSTEPGHTSLSVHGPHHRITVPSPKTEHHEGGVYRVIPLFPELRSHLEEADARLVAEIVENASVARTEGIGET